MRKEHIHHPDEALVDGAHSIDIVERHGAHAIAQVRSGHQRIAGMTQKTDENGVKWTSIGLVEVAPHESFNVHGDHHDIHQVTEDQPKEAEKA